MSKLRKHIACMSVIVLMACDMGIPTMQVDFSQLPDNQISAYIIKVYPNNPTDFKLVIKENLNGDYSAENIKDVVSQMGMKCTDTKCSYNGVVSQNITIHGEKKQGGFKFYMEINPAQGLDSFVSKRF